jgi:hypothetical protein
VHISERKTEQPTPPADHFVRAFVYLPRTSLVASMSQVIELGQVLAPYRGTEFGSAGGNIGISDGLLSQRQFSTTTLPMDRWVCFEVGIIRGNPGRIDVWIDGVEANNFPVMDDTAFLPPFG